MEKAIAYIRVSSDRQVQDGTSLVTQERRVKEYAATKDYDLLRIFVEEGETAKTDRRTELQAMLAFSKQHKGRIQVLIFPKIDRFARYIEDYYSLKATLRNSGMRVESADESFDDTPAGRFMETVLAGQAQFDNDLRAERSKGGMREAVLQGRWVWAAPVGYRNVRVNNKATIEPDPDKAPKIVEAFNLLASGRRPLDVRVWLREHGVLVGRSRFFTMFRSKAYLGIIEAFGVVQQGAPPFLPLVSESVFRRAQEAFRPARPRNGYQYDNPDFPLRGTLRCYCGSLLTASWSSGRQKRYPYYRCKSCPRVNLPLNAAHGAWLCALQQTASECLLPLKDEADFLVSAQQETQALREQVRNMERTIERFREIQKNIVLKNAEGVTPDTLARQQISELEDKIVETELEIDRLSVDDVNIQEAAQFARNFLTNICSIWEKANLSTKKHIQRFFFPKGGTVVSDPLCRTAKKADLTGSASSPGARLSSVGYHSDEAPHMLSRGYAQCIRELYREFGK
jgi:site-specific DNA recombinase